jgi:CBS domain-containing protein
MKVRDVMTPMPTCCEPDTALEVVARMMVQCDCGGIPVVEDLSTLHPVGMITDRDIVTRAVAAGVDPLELDARDCMTTPAFTVLEDTELDDCLEMLEQRQLRRVIVVDSDGRVSGIVASADVAIHASKREAGELLARVSERTPPSTVIY